MKYYDLHAHILPHMDHGCGRTETAVGQLSLMQEAGVFAVAATSHFYPQNTLPEVFLEERRESVVRLMQALGTTPRPRILSGAEVLICPGLENMEGLRELCLEGTDTMLLEMPFTHGGWDRALYHTIHEMQKQGIRPLLAHVDRYPPALIEELFENMGLTGQINADALARFVRPKHLLRWIDEGHIVAVGSDLHGREPRAYNSYRKLQEAMPERMERIMQATEKLLSGAAWI